MNRIAWLWVLLLVCSNLAIQGQNSPVLFTYGDDSVSLNEFAYVFQKNNPTNTDPSLQDLEDYLQLYINFKLKVAEAEALQIDTLPTVQRDLTNYLDQLYRSYLDKSILDTLFEEAYARMQYDVRTRHILIAIEPNAPPEDTLMAYKNIMDARQRILKGAAFQQVAAEVSEDKYASKAGGDIGYITGLTLPFYNFENAVYQTPVGSVSLPIRTRMGYHIVQPVEKRPAMGTVTVSHILIRVPAEADQAMTANLKRRADSIYTALIQGASFDSLAVTYSEDLVSKPRGGLMEPFGSGKMIGLFDSTAYHLQVDEISRPFRTNYGYHIIRKENQVPIASAEEVRESLQQKLARDNRYEIGRERLENIFRNDLSYLAFPERVDALLPLIDSSLYLADWRNPGLGTIEDKPLFRLGEAAFTMSEFLRFIEIRQVRRRDISKEELLHLYYDSFEQRNTLEYGLGQWYPEYPLLAQEYHDGILMFALMDKMVWNKAVEDTSGLKAYYEDHTGDHMWNKRAVADVFSFTSYEQAEKAARKVDKWGTDKLLKKLNKEATITPLVTHQEVTVEKGEDEWVDSTGWTPGTSPVYTTADSTYVVVRIQKILEPMPKSLQDARGAFISDYQMKLEKEWTARLREKYIITVEPSLLTTLID